ncbi:BREX-1 system adenine-specific DNA-methyltransferase PglX, partial [Mariniblastus sp.]|nr:BREX-1 system adenine-specific DNA-methyltransferase PglX [Mariniblastus sp.]
DKLALPGVPLEYLRFVRTESGNEEEGEDNSGPWTPAAGTFDAWPESLSELKTLDPCCGSGHFLVAALLMLTPMRMELEGLSANEAVDLVLAENLHGLEIDQRCVELAAFAIALTAWRFPDADGYRVLPDLNVACSGLSVSVAKEEWKELARGNKQLRIALDWMYDEFKDAPVLGSLLNPAKSMAAGVVKWEELHSSVDSALKNADTHEQSEVAVCAKGMAKAATLLGNKYTYLVTNVPYLVRGKQVSVLQEFCETKYADGQRDIATAFLLRIFEACDDGGTVAIVLPQNWLFLSSYKRLRNSLLKHTTWNFVSRLGAGAFDTISGEVVKAALFVASNLLPTHSSLKTKTLGGVNVSDKNGVTEKAQMLASEQVLRTSQKTILENPDARVTFSALQRGELVGTIAECYQGLVTGDIERFTKKLWEIDVKSGEWVPFRRSNNSDHNYGDVSEALFWQNGEGDLHEYAAATRAQLHDMHESGNRVWGKIGIAINRMGSLNAVPYFGEHFDNNVAVVFPCSRSNQDSLNAFFSSKEFPIKIRELDQAIKVTNRTLVKVPIDLERWQKVASEKYPHGLPEPYSDDPTQWIFHGHPASSTDALQVAVARLLGYRWPAELDAEMELATDARAWLERSGKLNDLADEDGIVCIPAVGTEQRAEDRLLNVLHRAYEEGRVQEQVFRDKLAEGNLEDPITLDLTRRDWQPSLPDSFNQWRDSLLEQVGHRGKTLESWLRDKFFVQHFKLFHHRPFIWHIWDGLPDGFSALINYHKLDNKLLKTLIYTYLNDWIKKQKNSSEDGHEERLAAAESLKLKLEKILEGESPHDIFVRWKTLEEQPIGWNPDLNDGVRLNIRPWMTVGDVKKKGAGILRDKPNCKWKKDRGK